MSLSGIGGVGGLGLQRMLPVPRNRVTGTFQNFLNGAKNMFSTAVNLVDGPQTDLLGLINQQVEAQKEMQLVTMISNLERSKHESKMSAIRNMRTG